MKWKERSTYFKVGVTAFCVIAASLLFFFFLFRTASIGKGLRTLINVLNPILYGFALAYIINPFMQLIENAILRLILKKGKTLGRRSRTAVRAASVLISTLIWIVMIYALIALILPDLIDSIRSIIRNFNQYVTNITVWINNTFANQELDAKTNEIIVTFANRINTWLDGSFMPRIDTVMSSLTENVVSVFTFLRDFLIGFIVSIYILIMKDTIKARFFRALYSVFSITRSNRIIKNLRFVDEKFGGFLLGKLLDSLIIGIICYICVLILQMPYPLLIAATIGVTNVIPFFGPFIGAIPSAILIFAVDPIKALIFLIFILILQQIDGNVIGPKILGNSVGISSFLVLISILLFGRMFGITGMILGVPLMAVLVYFVQSFMMRRLAKQKLTDQIEEYRNIEAVDPSTRKILPREQPSQKPSVYSRMKRRSEEVRAFDPPLELKSWDRTIQSVQEEDRLTQISKEEEEKSNH